MPRDPREMTTKGTKTASVPRMKERYQKEIVPSLMKERGYANPYEVPRLVKIVINMGVKEGGQDIKILDAVKADLATITGQSAIVTRARKSISAFKLREGAPIGLKVTLRGARMYEFLDRLINVAMPRVRDFRGIPDSGFDQQGNFSMGLQEQIIFPEVDYDKIKKTQGMDVTFVTTARRKDESKRLLELLGFPFRK